jgi:hypothetical protein
MSVGIRKTLLNHLKVSRIAVALAIVTAAWLPRAAHADPAFELIRIQCLPALGKVMVDTFTEWDICTSCKGFQALRAQGVYEVGAFLDHFGTSPFSCSFPDGKTATVRISDHGFDKIGDTWLKLEFKLGETLVGSTDTNGSNINAWMQDIPDPASVAFRTCVTSVDGFMGLPQMIHCNQRWIDYDGHTMVNGQKDSEYYTPDSQ